MFLVFVIMSVFFGAGMYYYFFSVQIALITGLSFGGIMAVFLGSMNILMHKDARKADGRLKQRRGMVISMPYKETFSLCKEALSVMEETKLTYVNEEEGVIRGEKETSVYSFGEKLECKAEAVSEITTKVWIESKPSYRFTLIDYGVNLRNVESFVKYFESKRVKDRPQCSLEKPTDNRGKGAII
ncbi:hypothetical protein EBO34_18160 [Alteribacter keqinensis]|uniref:Uncharacterized protein n=2 Tax=Alteribacter keqinensis TaxID=2483800 RepID=A0A3M7TNA7_9BACI|nr:hypothetical protein EBO34_18160 [Alteribacter keqinensis]